MTLQQLREQQRVAGITVPPPGGDDETAYIESRQPSWREENALPTRAKVQQIQTPSRGLRGYTRILPPGKNSVADLTGDWIIEFWDKPSPWCSIEGEPVHPEFDNNLKAFEGAA